MNKVMLYRLSLGFSILLTLAAFVSLLGWVGTLVRSATNTPLLALVPWVPLGLVTLAAVNCIVRARIIMGRGFRRVSNQANG